MDVTDSLRRMEVMNIEKIASLDTTDSYILIAEEKIMPQEFTVELKAFNCYSAQIL